MAHETTSFTIFVSLHPDFIEVEVSEPVGGTETSKMFADLLALGASILLETNDPKVLEAANHYLWVKSHKYGVTTVRPSATENDELQKALSAAGLNQSAVRAYPGEADYAESSSDMKALMKPLDDEDDSIDDVPATRH